MLRNSIIKCRQKEQPECLLPGHGRSAVGVNNQCVKSDVRFLIFGENFLLLEGRKSIFLAASRSQFVAIGPAKFLKIGQRITFLWPKGILNRNFAIAGEVIHDHKFSFYATFLT